MNKKTHIFLLDYIRALAIIHIVVYHFFLEKFHGSFLIVPEGIGANILRLELFKDGGILDFVKNIFAFLFVYGFTSVNLFLVLSGFVLTHSLLSYLATGRRIQWLEYLLKRWKRILIPFYFSVVIGIAILYARNFLFPTFSGAPLYDFFDLLRLIFVPFLFFDIEFLQKFNGDYWFIPLILQLYLIFPLLFIYLRKLRVAKFLGLIFIITIVYRFIAAYYLDSVPMGVLSPATHSYRLFSFFLPRLFEFAFGMVLAFLYNKKHEILERLIGFPYLMCGFFFTFCGFFANAYRWGWVFSDMFTGVGLFLLFLQFGSFLGRQKFLQKIMVRISEAAYEIFLLHHYFLNYLFLPFVLTLNWSNETAFWIQLPFFLILSVLIGRAAYYLSLAAEKGLQRRGS